VVPLVVADAVDETDAIVRTPPRLRFCTLLAAVANALVGTGQRDGRGGLGVTG